MPQGAEAEAVEVYEEARSAIATLIANVMAILRTFINWALSVFRQIITFAGEHPEAMIQTIGIATIWLTA